MKYPLTPRRIIAPAGFSAHRAVFVMGVLAAFGTLVIWRSLASSAPAGFQAEQGVLSPNAVKVVDAAASEGGAVQFKAAAAPSPTPAVTFAHPGVLVSRSQLDFVKAKIAAKAEPWTTALLHAKGAKASGGGSDGVAFASLSYVPHPIAWVGCGAYHNPNEGCFDETNDANAAYTQALLWYYTGDARYAEKSIQIMNAWSSTLVGHKFDLTTYQDGNLQAAWGGEMWPRAGEIIRHTYTPAAGATPFDLAKFTAMLKNAYLPMVIDGWPGGGFNRLASQAEATVNIGIFTDDRAVFDNGIGDWRANVPCTIYMPGDVNKWPQLAGLPNLCPGSNLDKSTTTRAALLSLWNNPSAFPAGLEGETCRDLNHTAMGYSGTFNVAETARIQGLDLYSEQQARLIAGLELNSGVLNSILGGTNPPPGWACPTNPVTTVGAWKTTFEIAKNHYVTRLGLPLPQTSAFVKNIVEPSSYVSAMQSSYEVLTHYGTP